jgi:hypothetical protein
MVRIITLIPRSWSYHAITARLPAVISSRGHDDSPPFIFDEVDADKYSDNPAFAHRSYDTELLPSIAFWHLV